MHYTKKNKFDILSELFCININKMLKILFKIPYLMIFSKVLMSWKMYYLVTIVFYHPLSTISFIRVKIGITGGFLVSGIY